MIQNNRTLKLVILAATFLLPRLAQADSLTWTGAVNNSWNTIDANWSGADTVYANGDTVLFGTTTSGVITGIVSRSPGSTHAEYRECCELLRESMERAADEIRRRCKQG